MMYMLSNKIKLQLVEKFDNLYERRINKTKKDDTDADTDTTDTDEDTTDTDTTDTDTTYTDTDEDTIVETYIHAVDKLKKDIPKKKYSKIKACVYKINIHELHPFIMFLLYKYDRQRLDFVDIENNEGNVVDYVLSKFRKLFENEKDVKIEYKGFIEYGDELMICIKYSIKKEHLTEGKNDSKYWWALTSEIINNKSILNFDISKTATKFLLENTQICLLYNSDGYTYETPEVGYYGNYYKKIVSVASLGLSRETTSASFGPFYYFSDFNRAMRYAFWTSDFKSQKIGDEFITIDDKGRYKKGGIVRFALFAGKTKMLLGRKNDMPDDSSISQELADKHVFVKNMLTLRDSGAKWIKEFDSIRIGYHAKYKFDKDQNVNIKPMVVLKDYQQQYPLEFYFVDTSQITDINDIGKAIIN